MSNSQFSPSAMSRRQFLKVAAAGAGMLAVAACAPVQQTAGGDAASAPASGPTTIKFLTQGGDQGAFDRYLPLIESFQKANADITVEPIFEPGGAIEVQTKLLTLIAAGEAPDAYWAHSYTNSGQSKRDIQMDIT